MKQACFRFYAELNDFLPPGRRMVGFTRAFEGSPSVKDLIEALGVPHTEVDLILVNGISVDFSYRVREGDRISVYPVFESIDITPLVRVRPRPLRETRFVLDAHLGRLAGYLRMLGFDTLYRNDYRDEELERISGARSRRFNAACTATACFSRSAKRRSATGFHPGQSSTTTGSSSARRAIASTGRAPTTSGCASSSRRFFSPHRRTTGDKGPGTETRTDPQGKREGSLASPW